MFTKKKMLTTMCPLCESERKVYYGVNKETIDVRGEKINVSAKVFYCPKGNHFFSNMKDEEEKIQHVYREFRSRKKLLQPEEIKLIRDKYNLSQEAFSAFLGFGKKTIHRYETGAIPDYPHNSMILFMQYTKNFFSQYEQVKEKLSLKLRQKIEKRINELQLSESQLTFPSSFFIQPKSVQLYATTVTWEVKTVYHSTTWDEAIDKTYVHVAYYSPTLVKPKELKADRGKDNSFKENAIAA